jgi:hypothetical protein
MRSVRRGGLTVGQHGKGLCGAASHRRNSDFRVGGACSAGTLDMERPQSRGVGFRRCGGWCG